MRALARVIATALLGIPLALVPATAAAVCNNGVGPDCVDRFESLTGTVDFFATGASFAVNEDTDDRPDRALEEATVIVPERRVPGRARLVRAFIYFGGSLFDDDDNNEDPDREIELRVPGTSDFARVQADQVYQSGVIQGFEEVRLYTARAEITELIRSAGGNMIGAYTVRGFEADIFFGMQEHTAANASFSIVLLFEEPRLPPRTIVLFDGMQEVLGSTVALTLGGFLVSPVPSGTLTIYAEEGDCNPGPMDCENGNNLAGAERVRLISSDPGRRLVLTDPVNPPNDVFNRTINTVDPPLRDVPGTDIDTFDITPVLRPADEEIRVEITAPVPSPQRMASGELVGLVYVIVGIDVFLPELRIDSRIEVAAETGETRPEYAPGDPLRVTYAISNTGNLPATGVRVEAELPENVTSFEVLEEPGGASVTVDESGGAAGKGRVVIDDLAVRHGEVNDLVLLVTTECPLESGGILALSATVSAAREGGLPFAMSSTTSLLARDRCGPQFFLFGGGGCRASEPKSRRSASIGLAFVAVMLVALQLRRRFAALLLLVLAASFAGCGKEEEQPDLPPPDVFGVPCPGDDSMVAIPSIRNLGAFCIDRFEASGEGDLGNADQSSAGERGDGSTTVAAESKRFVQPLSGVSWFQANASCQNGGKRLCSADEWLTACRGASDVTYPYGDEFRKTTCNGYDAGRSASVETGAMIVRGSTIAGGAEFAFGCVTQHGAYDMSGNVWEWNAESYFDGARRGLTGGSFRSNEIGLRCVTEDNHERPAQADETYGFRCCRDLR
jgi:formylglycine-generating enzyme